MTGWAAFAAELDRWRGAGRVATFWWRDDDAIAPSAALDRLLEMRTRAQPPLTLAVIPARATAALAGRLAGEGAVTPVQHGYDHANHAPPGAGKAELGDHRPVAETIDELAAGRGRMRALFGATPPLLVPPWNRIGAGVAAALPGLGYRALSTFGADHRAAAGMIQINTHIDIIDWPGTRRFVGVGAALDAAIAHLRARRDGHADADQPTGLLTHHLAHDAGCWDFVAEFVARVAAHDGARLVDAAQCLDGAP